MELKDFMIKLTEEFTPIGWIIVAIGFGLLIFALSWIRVKEEIERIENYERVMDRQADN